MIGPSARHTYEWTVARKASVGEARDVRGGLSGANVSFVFTSVGEWDVELVETSARGQTWATSRGVVVAKYVRRELRSLDDADREAFLAALHTIYSLSSDEGKQKYGESYEGIAYFARIHLYGAAARDCDHWHDDAGLMVHHMAFTLQLERGLQAIDPSLAVPYWDYTIDAFEYGDGWEDSPVFGESWFGSAAPGGAHHVVETGRWAYTRLLDAASGARDYSSITNPYGVLRSPWNTNPHAYLTRTAAVFRYKGAGYTTFPGCAEFHECFNHRSLSGLNECLNGYTHGPVHIMLGGQWNGEATRTATISAYQAERIQLLIFKVLWRMGFAECPHSCGNGTSASLGTVDACRCSCPAAVRKAHGTDLYRIATNVTGLLHWVYAVAGGRVYLDEPTGKYGIVGADGDKFDAALEELWDGFCDPGHVGELYTSNAPADPLFWPIHTTAERLLAWRRVLSHHGKGHLNQSWGYEHPSNTPSDFGRVCDWAEMTAGQMLPECRRATCKGHNPDDRVPGLEEFTNQQFYDFMDPYNIELPYLYDTFDWPHCDAQNYRLSAKYWFQKSGKHGTPVSNGTDPVV